MRKILIIQLSRLGDLVQTIPLARRLKVLHKGCHVTILCIKGPASILHNVDAFDRVVEVADDMQSQWFQCVTGRYDSVVNLSHCERSGRICAAIDAEEKAGRVATYAGEIRAFGDWSKYLFALPRYRRDNLFNLVDIYMGIGGVSPGPVEASLEIDQGGLCKAKALLEKNGHEHRGKLVALQLGANQAHRAWPARRFARLAAELGRIFPLEVVLLGTEDEKPLGSMFAGETDIPVIDLMGKTELESLPAVLKCCDLLISHDTGTVHIAAAVGTQTLGLYFSTAYFGETAPYGKGHVVIQADAPCVPCRSKEICEGISCKDSLTVPLVKDVAEKILQGDLNFDEVNTPGVRILKSTFLSNGTMLYVPVSNEVSERYVTAVVNRLVWESVLGMDNDERLRKLICEKVGSNGFAERIRQRAETLGVLQRLYERGHGTSKGLESAFRRGSNDRHRILRDVKKLESLETKVKELRTLPGQFLDFHNMEFMDMEYAQFPALATEYGIKYHKLSKSTKRGFTTLKGLLSS